MYKQKPSWNEIDININYEEKFHEHINIKTDE